MLFVFITGLLFITEIPESHAQVKLSDRKSEAYRNSRKNKNKKQKKRRKRYKEADKRNLSAGEMEVTPEVLKEQYVPKDQNAEKNPSKQIFNSYQKQSRIFTRKARQALDQGLMSRNRLKTRERRYRKQSRVMANHQGNIRIDPARTGDNRGMFPQPPTEQNPGRANNQIRNKKLSQYALKADEMSMQGLISVPSQGIARRQHIRQSRKMGLDQGKLKYNQRQKEANYMAKSVEAMSQGLRKSMTARDRQQQSMSNSLVQSQFQGNMIGKSRKEREGSLIGKSLRNQQVGRNYKLNPREKENNYMAKSVEALSQGMIVRKDRNRTESHYIRKSKQAQDQGMNYTQNPREKQAGYMAKSVEGLNQGLMVKKSRNQKESQYIRKSKQALDQGMISSQTQRQKDAGYMAKSVEGLSQGLIVRKSRNQKESQYIRKSKQALDQGMISSQTQRQKDAGYMAKSVEALNQGMKKSVTMREQKQQWMSNSLTQSQFQGNLAGKSHKEREADLNNRSIRNQRVGMDYKLNTREKENSYMAKSVEALSQGMIIRKNRSNEESQYIRKSKEALDQGMISTKNMKQKEAIYMGKSVEMLNQGMTIRQSRNKRESQYIRKSIEALNTGMISTMTQRQKEAIYMGKSVELLSQGMFRARSQQDKESMYIRKSIEAADQGMFRGPTRKEKEMDYIQRSLKNQQVGLVKVQRQKAREAEMRDVSREVQNYRGDEKIRTDFLKDWADRRRQAKYVFYTGNFKVQNKLFENLENRRMSARRAKFDGMDQETRFESWWASLWKKPVDQRKKPEPLKKPRYDSKDNDIWFY